VSDPKKPAPPLPVRIAGLDAFRGLVLALMMGEALHFCGVAAALPASALWAFLCHHQDHVAWVGCSLHDLIQPGFSFLVGAAMPFSMAARAVRGQSRGAMILHAFRRALILVVLGIFLRSLGHPQTRFTFEDTLTQIGLGYGFLFLLGLRPRRDQWIALALVLAASWGAFALYPAPGPGFAWEAVGVDADWPHLMTGFAAHWNKNENLSAWFDRRFLNLFPREEPFVYNGGGYQTLSFVPTLGTMILGLLAGGVLRGERTSRHKLTWLLASGAAGIASGWLLGAIGLCPVVKRIWTPSFTLYSGGWCFLFTAAFYWVMDLRGRVRWAFPLTILGMNSIAAYCMNWVLVAPVAEALVRHLGRGPFLVLGPVYERTLVGAASLLVVWLILLWMHRRRIFIRI
jgi:heparan-alpha-glucosaminide N-acetyltransferase